MGKKPEISALERAKRENAQHDRRWNIAKAVMCLAVLLGGWVVYFVFGIGLFGPLGLVLLLVVAIVTIAAFVAPEHYSLYIYAFIGAVFCVLAEFFFGL